MSEIAARSESRPSSSSEAASLFPFSAATMGFGGYVGNSRVYSSLTSTSDGSTFLPKQDIDALLVVQLKQLSRKDPTTKATDELGKVEAYHNLCRILNILGSVLHSLLW